MASDGLQSDPNFVSFQEEDEVTKKRRLDSAFKSNFVLKAQAKPRPQSQSNANKIKRLQEAQKANFIMQNRMSKQDQGQMNEALDHIYGVFQSNRATPTTIRSPNGLVRSNRFEEDVRCTK